MSSAMWASTWNSYGSPTSSLAYIQIPRPAIRNPADVLVRVRAAGLVSGDCELRSLKPFPFPYSLLTRLGMAAIRPRTLGQEFAGVVEAVGPAVTRFKRGDAVFGTTGWAFGAHAEYLVVRSDAAADQTITLKPDNLTWPQAAVAGMSGLEAMSFLAAGKVKPGDRVLILGAGGCVGSFSVQLAKAHFGASYVAAVDGPEQQAMLRDLGCDRVIDYTAEPDHLEKAAASGERYDVVLDIPGTSTYSRCALLLSEGGTYAMGFFLLPEWVESRRSNGRMVLAMAKYEREGLQTLTSLIATGKVRPVVDRVFPLESAVQAHEYFESGMKKGCVAIVMPGVE